MSDTMDAINETLYRLRAQSIQIRYRERINDLIDDGKSAVDPVDPEILALEKECDEKVEEVKAEFRAEYGKELEIYPKRS